MKSLPARPEVLKATFVGEEPPRQELYTKVTPDRPHLTLYEKCVCYFAIFALPPMALYTLQGIIYYSTR